MFVQKCMYTVYYKQSVKEESYHIFLGPRRRVVLLYFQFQYISFPIKCKTTVKFYHTALIASELYRNFRASYIVVISKH